MKNSQNEVTILSADGVTEAALAEVSCQVVLPGPDSGDYNTQVGQASENDQYLCRDHQRELLEEQKVIFETTEIRDSYEINEKTAAGDGDGVEQKIELQQLGEETVGDYEASVRCEDCGHEGVTATDNTSQAPMLNQSQQINLEDEKSRAEYNSPSAEVQQRQKSSGNASQPAGSIPSAIKGDYVVSTDTAQMKPPSPSSNLMSTNSAINPKARTRCEKCGSSRLIATNPDDQRATTA